MRKLVLVALLVAVAVGGSLYHYRRFLWPDPRGAHVTRFTLTSRVLGRRLGEIVVAPREGGYGRPVLVFLHGRGGGPGGLLTDEFYKALADLGPRAPDVVLVNGGDHSYFHDRADGAWGRYVLEEAIPAGIRLLGGDSRRVAITGISMGGFGALDLAIQHPGRFCAAGGESAAMWRTGSETPAGAFDDAADFARNDVLAIARSRHRAFGRTRVWISVGRGDPFYAADAELASTLRTQGQPRRFYTGPGGHDHHTFWSQAPTAFRFYAAALAAC
jgi:S-formylglutathione hydrolase FrmB